MNKLFTQHRRAETLQDAIDGAIDHLESGRIQDYVEKAFNGEFGDEPVLTFKINVRRDVATAGKFAYSVNTRISHDLGKPITLHGLEL